MYPLHHDGAGMILRYVLYTAAIAVIVLGVLALLN
jgi:hypothetical protein